jgi:lysophospholipase L1-like esterase
MSLLRLLSEGALAQTPPRPSDAGEAAKDGSAQAGHRTDGLPTQPTPPPPTPPPPLPAAPRPAPTPPGTQPAPSAGQPPLQRALQRMEEWRRGRIRIYMNDFGELGRYRKPNARLAPPAANEARVIFLGDSITDAWRLDTSFPGKPYINRGIAGQTTSQMLVRFRQDVIDLRPKVVVILAGTNDIAGNTGPMSLEEIEANFTSMLELARAHGIAVVLSSIIPVHGYTPQSDLSFPLRPPEKILELNRWLKSTCAAGGHVYLDYFSAMVDDKGFLKPGLAEDGLHPNRAGYAVMAPLAAGAIAKAVPPATGRRGGFTTP